MTPASVSNTDQKASPPTCPTNPFTGAHENWRCLMHNIANKLVAARNLPDVLPIPPLLSVQTSVSVYIGPEAPNLALYLRSEEHTSELQLRGHLVCRLLLDRKNRNTRSG